VCSDTCESRATTCCASTSASRHRDMLPCARAQSMPAQTPTHARAHTQMHTCYFRHASWCSLQMCVLRHTHTHMHTHVRIHSLFWILNTTCSSAIQCAHQPSAYISTQCTHNHTRMHRHICTHVHTHRHGHGHTHSHTHAHAQMQINTNKPADRFWARRKRRWCEQLEKILKSQQYSHCVW